MNKMKQRLGPIFPIVVFMIVSLFILSLSRLGLALWQAERIDGIYDWWQILVQGLRIDVSTLCWLYSVPALLAVILPQSGLIGKIWRIILQFWLVAGLWLVVYMELSTPSFIMEYDLRPNRLFIEYLIYPKEVLSMLWVGYKLELAIGGIGSVLAVILAWKLSSFSLKNIQMPKWYWRPALALVVIALALMGGRSTFGHRPINPAMVAFSTDPLLNDLTLNSIYSVIFAAKNMAAEVSAENYYGKMDRQDIIHYMRQSTGREQSFISDEIPSLSAIAASYTGKKKNLVILLQESLGARFVGGLGGLPLTPNLDNLLQEGWNFNHAFATGTRSVRGIEAVTTGFSPTPSRAVVKLGKSQTGFFSIAQLLANNGYHTQFVYGGESHFDNMKSFFLGNGFAQIVDLPRFTKPSFVGSWGASDQDLYNEAHQQFELLNKKQKPFFSLVFTSSNHTPYEFPDADFELHEQPKNTRNNAVKYSDYALGEFFKKAKSSSYWQDTVFLIIADHDARANGSVPVPVSHFHIPAVIVGEGIEAKQDDRIVSNIDMPPTLLSLIGVNNISPMIGHDLTKFLDPKFERAMMQFSKNFGYLTNEKLVVLQPEKQAIAYHYDFATKALTPTDLNQNENNVAKANALWGSLAYNQGLYKLPNEAELSKLMVAE